MKKLAITVLCCVLALSSVVLLAGCGVGSDARTIYTVTVTGGTGGGRYYENDNCKVTATVPEGKQFMKWVINGDDVSANEEFVFAVKKDVGITAVFSDAVLNADKDVFTVKTINGVGDGGYLSGSECSVEVVAAESDRSFLGWANVDSDGNAGEIVSESNPYKFTVTEDITLSAQFGDIRLDTPLNNENQMFKKMGSSYSDMIVEIDRQKNADNSRKTAFTDGVDYVLFYIYTSPFAEKTAHVGSFKLVQTVKGANAQLQTIDGSKFFTAGSTPGDYYFDRVSNADFFAFIAASVGEDYSEAQAYYVAAQLISVPDSNYVNSAISDIGTSVIQQN